MAEEYIIEEIIKTLINNMADTIQKIDLIRMKNSKFVSL
jgi:hypothetical protein